MKIALIKRNLRKTAPVPISTLYSAQYNPFHQISNKNEATNKETNNQNHGKRPQRQKKTKKSKLTSQ